MTTLQPWYVIGVCTEHRTQRRINWCHRDQDLEFAEPRRQRMNYTKQETAKQTEEMKGR